MCLYTCSDGIYIISETSRYNASTKLTLDAAPRKMNIRFNPCEPARPEGQENLLFPNCVSGIAGSSPPEPIKDLPMIGSIAAGSSYSFFVDIEGVVWTCGQNVDYQLGIGQNNVDYATQPQKS